MIDLELKRVVFHDDNVDTVFSGSTLSVNVNEAATILSTIDVGEFVCNYNGWMPPETEKVLMGATALVREIILEQFLMQPEMAIWIGEEERVKVGMASESIFLYFTRPGKHKINLYQAQIDAMQENINKTQDLFELGVGHVSFGSPEGGSIQFSYKLKEETK